MRLSVTIKDPREFESEPRTCSECPFSDACDGRIAKLTKRGGMEWTNAAMKGRPKGCPLVVEP